MWIWILYNMAKYDNQRQRNLEDFETSSQNFYFFIIKSKPVLELADINLCWSLLYFIVSACLETPVRH